MQLAMFIIFIQHTFTYVHISLVNEMIGERDVQLGNDFFVTMFVTKLWTFAPKDFFCDINVSFP